jgi:tyrosine-protein phosphatase SIW14
MNKIKILLITFTSVIAIGCSTTKMQHGIPNFRQVDKNVYRGGQPTVAGWYYLKSIGIKNVVKLNDYSEGSSDNIATDMGMKVYCFPITLTQQTIGEPDKYQLMAAAAFSTPVTGPVFIHCTHGQDRTGLLVGIYRCDIDHWPKQKAEREMIQNGFHVWLRGLYWSWQKWKR